MAHIPRHFINLNDTGVFGGLGSEGGLLKTHWFQKMLET